MRNAVTLTEEEPPRWRRHFGTERHSMGSNEDRTGEDCVDGIYIVMEELSDGNVLVILWLRKCAGKRSPFWYRSHIQCGVSRMRLAGLCWQYLYYYGGIV